MSGRLNSNSIGIVRVAIDDLEDIALPLGDLVSTKDMSGSVWRAGPRPGVNLLSLGENRLKVEVLDRQSQHHRLLVGGNVNHRVDHRGKFRLVRPFSDLRTAPCEIFPERSRFLRGINHAPMKLEQFRLCRCFSQVVGIDDDLEDSWTAVTEARDSILDESIPIPGSHRLYGSLHHEDRDAQM